MQTWVRSAHSSALEMAGFQRERAQALETDQPEVMVLYQQLTTVGSYWPSLRLLSSPVERMPIPAQRSEYERSNQTLRGRWQNCVPLWNCRSAHHKCLLLLCDSATPSQRLEGGLWICPHGSLVAYCLPLFSCVSRILSPSPQPTS